MRASSPTFRPLKPNEQALLDGFLAQDFRGVEALREQAVEAEAAPGCACSCGTLELKPGPAPPSSVRAGPVPVHGDVLDEHGRSVGGLLLFIDDDGYLTSLEVFSHEDPPLALPDIAQVTWFRADPLP